MTAEPIKSARGGANPPQQHPLHYCTVLQGTGPVGKQFLSILDLGLLKGTGSTCFKMCVVFFSLRYTCMFASHVCFLPGQIPLSISLHKTNKYCNF